MNQNHKKMTERPTKTTIEQYAREGRKMMRNNKKASHLVSEIFGLVTDMLVVSFKVFGSCLWL